MGSLNLGLPPQASTFGPEIDGMLVTIHWLMLVMMVAWGAAFLYGIIKYRGGKGRSAQYNVIKGKFPWIMVALVAIFETYTLAFHDIPFWSHLRNDMPSEDESTVVRVVAEQFAWNFHYPGEDGVFGRTAPELIDVETNPIGLDPDDSYGDDDITTINQLYVPVDKPVIAHLSSKDVIHSFGVPVMRVKQDVIPGMSIPVWFVPNRVGPEEGVTWDIACSQLCGLGHYRMRGFVNVLAQADYDAWLAQKAEEKAAAGDDNWW